MNKKITGLAAVSFLFALAGIVISALLLREDVTSTAHTIFEYFPSKYGVTPSSTWQGAIILGVFTSVLQVIAANVAFSDKFSGSARGVAGLSLVMSLVFDNWTDVVFRSGGLTGNMPVAIATTVAFYTLGSEITQGLAWMVVAGTWRAAISDLMWMVAKTSYGFRTIGSEWNGIKRASSNAHRPDNTPDNKPSSVNKPVWPPKPSGDVKKPVYFTPQNQNKPNSQRKPD